MRKTQRGNYERLAATFAMVTVKMVIRCIHNREVEALKEEVIQHHWDLYAAGKVSQEWEAQPY